MQTPQDILVTQDQGQVFMTFILTMALVGVTVGVAGGQPMVITLPCLMIPYTNLQ